MKDTSEFTINGVTFKSILQSGFSGGAWIRTADYYIDGVHQSHMHYESWLVKIAEQIAKGGGSAYHDIRVAVDRLRPKEDGSGGVEMRFRG